MSETKRYQSCDRAATRRSNSASVENSAEDSVVRLRRPDRCSCLTNPKSVVRTVISVTGSDQPRPETRLPGKVTFSLLIVMSFAGRERARSSAIDTESPAIASTMPTSRTVQGGSGARPSDSESQRSQATGAARIPVARVTQMIQDCLERSLPYSHCISRVSTGVVLMLCVTPEARWSEELSA